MKNSRPIDSAGAYLQSHFFHEFANLKPAFSPCPKVSHDWYGQGKSLLAQGNRLKNQWRRLMLSILLVICVSLALSVPAGAVVQQLPPELKEALEYHKAGKFRDAIEVYSEYLAKNPRSPEALNWRGMAYDDAGEPDKALDDFNKAIEIKPDYADAFNNRGEVYRKQNKLREALMDYRKAVEFDKNFPEAHYNLALVHEAQKRNDQALQEYSAYLRLKPDAPDKQQVTEKIEALKKLVPPAPPRTQAPQPGAERKPGERPGMQKPSPPKAGVAPAPTEPVIPGMPPLPPEAIPGLGILLGLGMFALIIPLALYIFFAVMLYLIANKTATDPAWLAFIPIVNTYLCVKIADKPIWWLVLLFLPAISPVFGMVDANIAAIVSGLASLVSLVAWLFISLGIAAARGKSIIWGILLFLPCTNLIALGYLGLSE